MKLIYGREAGLGLLSVAMVYLWIFISPFYYSGNFFTGNLIVPPGEDFIHRLFKYVVAISICIFFFLRRPSTNIFYLYLFFSVVLMFFLFLSFDGYSTRAQMALLLVFISFSGFILFPLYMTDDQLDLMLGFVIISSVFVSLISFYEYFYMWPVLGEYWRDTGGYRSVSTMLNPNNLGVYMGVSLLILLLHSRFAIFWRSLAVVIIATALFMSGSRTAVVSMIIPLFLGLLLLKGLKLKIKHSVFYIILMVFLCCFLVFVVINGYLPSGRYFNMESAVIRLDKYFSYLSMFDFSYIFPDFNSHRSFYVSESSYFYFFNTFGIALSIIFIIVYFTVFRINWGFLSVAGPRRILALIVLYYVITFLFENMISSFPNNQFFFFALGAMLLPRRIGLKARGCYV